MEGWNVYEIGKDLNAPPCKSITSISRIVREHMEVMWIAPDGSIQDAYFYEKQQPAWKHFELAPPGSASVMGSGGITSVTRRSDHMEVWWIGVDGSIEGSYWYDDVGHWTRYQLAPNGSATLESSIFGQSRNSANMNLWWIGPMGSVEGCKWTETVPWTRYQIVGNGSAASKSSLTAVSRISTSEELWWQSPEGSVEGSYWYENNDGVWHRYQIASAGNVAIGSGMKAISRVPNIVDVYWIHPYGSVQESFWAENATSRVTSEIAPSGSADLKSGMTGVSRKSNTETLWWVSPAGEVIVQYWYDGYSKWRSIVLSPAGSAQTNIQLASVSRDKGFMEIWCPSASSILVDWYCYQNIPPPVAHRSFRSKFKLYLINTNSEGKNHFNFYTDKWKGVYLRGVDLPENTVFADNDHPYGKFLAENPDEGTIMFGGLPAAPGTTGALGDPDGNGSYTTGLADGYHFGGYGDGGLLQNDSPWSRSDVSGQQITDMFDAAYKSGICPNGIFEMWQSSNGSSGQSYKNIGDFALQFQVSVAIITMRIIDIGIYQGKVANDQENAYPPDGMKHNSAVLK